jgi:hypothetical protein
MSSFLGQWKFRQQSSYIGYISKVCAVASAIRGHTIETCTHIPPARPPPMREGSEGRKGRIGKSRRELGELPLSGAI